ncbi:DUF2231 domain-containing protein [Bdellovibrio bacteriovorus]|uniref:DUF2231 domain-containing protein n=1 Tax=Bdellovibrio bacteriovorus TaxID=959 RepID=UPI0021D2ACA5|nr:DUF2231 domain-containing protein [Bdellovibrio bacteriovorus]UXR65992.1 DUF2231 domain-containing protein [Bdellovibrio bacteriovorus]
MYSKVSIKGHGIHPMLVAFPITFYLLTFVSFLVYQLGSVEIFWYKLGYFSNMAAVACAVVAAIPGFIDWAMGIPKDTTAKRDGLIHMLLNVLTLGLFAVNAVLIGGTWDMPLNSLAFSLVLTGVGCLSLVGAGAYGWTLVAIHKVGVPMSSEQAILQDRYEHDERPQDHISFH